MESQNLPIAQEKPFFQNDAPHGCRASFPRHPLPHEEPVRRSRGTWYPRRQAGVYGDQAGLDLRLSYSSPSGVFGVFQSLGKTKRLVGGGAGQDHITQLEKNIKFYYYSKMNSD